MITTIYQCDFCGVKSTKLDLHTLIAASQKGMRRTNNVLGHICQACITRLKGKVLV